MLVHLQVENTRRCCAAIARGEVNIGIVGGEIPRELEHLLQVRSCPLPRAPEAQVLYLDRT